MTKEFSIIQQYFTNRQQHLTDIALGSGDDCAVIDIPKGQQLAVSIDTSVANQHFFADTNPFDIGHKVVAVSLSDCAAMGATPKWLTLTASLESIDENWIRAFADGVFSCLNRYDTLLIGGDCTKGPMSFTSQIHGVLPKGSALKRNGAQIGDSIYVTGQLGDAALALQTLFNKQPKYAKAEQQQIEQRLHRPTPRIEIGQAIRSLAHACIDLSDGLAADLSHILNASNCGATLFTHQLPLSATLQTLTPQLAYTLALSGGDDYELCFTAPPEAATALQTIAQQYQTPITAIGEIHAKPGLQIQDQNHKIFQLESLGFEHQLF